MGNFRQEGRGGFGGRSRFGGNRSGGRSGDRGGFRGRDSRRNIEMHEVTCDKCGKQCEVPFKPSEDKPVYCSDCFKKEGSGSKSGSSGMSSEQFNEINKKLDKILQALEMIETEKDSDEDEEDESN